MTKLQSLGLIETTSKTQAKNGTQCFHDPIVNCDYLSYESGYVRRAFAATSSWYGRPTRTIYQLNKTRKGVYEYKGRSYDTTERIMIPNNQDRLERIAHCVATYRNNKNN